MKAVMYIYNGNEAEADLELDQRGIFPTPMGGTVLNRRDKPWEVVRTTIVDPHVQSQVMPVLKIYLTDQF